MSARASNARCRYSISVLPQVRNADRAELTASFKSFREAIGQGQSSWLFRGSVPRWVCWLARSSPLMLFQNWIWGAWISMIDVRKCVIFHLAENSKLYTRTAVVSCGSVGELPPQRSIPHPYQTGRFRDANAEPEWRSCIDTLNFCNGMDLTSQTLQGYSIMDLPAFHRAAVLKVCSQIHPTST